MKMLEKIADRRHVNIEDKEKIEVGYSLFNSLTALAKYSAEGLFTRWKGYETNFIAQSKIKN